MPANDPFRGDEQIRTAATCLSMVSIVRNPDARVAA